MAFTAQIGNDTKLGWIVFSTAIIWAVIYDTFYAMSDRKDDLKIGIKSTAILFDDADRFIIGIIQVLVLVALIIVGKQANLGLIYHFSIIFVVCCSNTNKCNEEVFQIVELQLNNKTLLTLITIVPITTSIFTQVEILPTDLTSLNDLQSY